MPKFCHFALGGEGVLGVNPSDITEREVVKAGWRILYDGSDVFTWHGHADTVHDIQKKLHHFMSYFALVPPY